MSIIISKFAAQNYYLDMKYPTLLLLSLCMGTVSVQAQDINRGATEQSPSRSEYFSWINNSNEGPTEAQTLANLDFFEWMRNKYGMQLDIYAFDAGVFDSKNYTALMDAPQFKRNFPNGLDRVYQKAKKNGIRLGLWGGPDGFGDTPESAKARKDMMVSLCRDYNWALFKFDAVCGRLRPEKEDDFIDMMQQCRKYSPDLILLNHRLGLERAQQYATTFLWEGRESYTDANTPMANTTAPHHRVGSMGRGLVPDMQRLTEDHGVCLSSCMDNWDDELVLQAFNRSLILSPQIYGNPWLLGDGEFPKLARIFNLSKAWAPLLTQGIALPEGYGASAVARGDGQSRIVTLRNLSWETKTVKVNIGQEIGLTDAGKYRVTMYHPQERVLGSYRNGQTVSVQVPPFRAVLLLVTNQKKYEVKLQPELSAKPLTYQTLATLSKTELPKDAAALYETAVFAADNNAMECRSLDRAGKTAVPQVQAARDAFFYQETFLGRGLWDHFLFDNDQSTYFAVSRDRGDLRVKGGCFRLDLGEVIPVDSIVIDVDNLWHLQPLRYIEGNYASVSADLDKWNTLVYAADRRMTLKINQPMRYLKMRQQPEAIHEIVVYSNGKKVSPEKFRASNLFADRFIDNKKSTAYSATVTIPQGGVRLYVALEGKHGVEGAYAALRVGNRLVGPSDRTPSYPAGAWESTVQRSDKNYTYLFDLTPDMVGQSAEVVVVTEGACKLTPRVIVSL